MIQNGITTKAIIKIIGERLQQARLNRNITQQDLANSIGVSSKTISNIEQGKNYNLSVLIDILRKFNMLENIDGLIPEQPISPLLIVETQKKSRKRASKSVQPDNEDSEW
ncbi:MAG: helix-turn-helix domain-containing protein [Geovibrio sp.]|nr:helix-turn-helix domain-containing protein [Geovibrio sp.]